MDTKMSNMTLEQFEKFAVTLPADVDRRKIAKAMGIELPVVIAPLDDQLNKIDVVKHVGKQTKRNPSPQETVYVAVPSLKLDQNSGTRGFWVNAKVARKIAQQIIAVCNKNNL